MYLRELNLFDFKNYDRAQFHFTHQINCFLGPNGIGKTNILDAIYHLCFTRSALNAMDSYSIKQGSNQFIIRGNFIVENIESEVVYNYTNKAKKGIRVEGKPRKRLDHIGHYPLVLMAPHDIELIQGGSRMRRKFFDTLIAQIDRPYLETLMTYTHQLKQRNSLLESHTNQNIDYDLLNIYDQKLVLTASSIYRKRFAFMKEFMPIFFHYYNLLTGKILEKVAINYRSDCADQNMGTKLKNSRQKDLLLQRTNVGIHRDDFIFLLNAGTVKNIASQGQQKSFLIALKLAEFHSIERNKGFKPLLLLDDIFDKLDDERMTKLINLIAEGVFGHLFITDARSDRSRKLLSQLDVKPEFFQLDSRKT